jgi:hypothetical protein
VYIHIHTYTYIHIHTHIYTHIHIPPNKPSKHWGKILEKALVNRINHHIYVTEYLKKNQYGFIPQTSTIDAIMAVKEFVREGFSRGEITVTVSLDVEGAFNSAWWPSVLKNLQESGCPRTYSTLQKITSANEKQPWQETTSP